MTPPSRDLALDYQTRPRTDDLDKALRIAGIALRRGCERSQRGALDNLVDRLVAILPEA